MKQIILIFLVNVLFTPIITWKQIDDGLFIGEYKSPQLSEFDNSIITILKVDPNKYNFELWGNKSGYTAKEWSDKLNLSAVINAGMYDSNGVNLGLMIDYDTMYNSKPNQDQAILAFNPANDSMPNIQIVDLPTQGAGVLKHYNSLTQSIRMVDLDGNNKWSKRDSMWSVVVVAIDKDGNALFIHSRSPYTMHDFINILLESPLNIKNVMYLEGGPEASLYVNHNGFEISRIGSYETGFFDNSNTKFWQIPNIIGIIKK